MTALLGRQIRREAGQSHFVPLIWPEKTPIKLFTYSKRAFVVKPICFSVLEGTLLQQLTLFQPLINFQ